jgi:hypothetical protein
MQCYTVHTHGAKKCVKIKRSQLEESVDRKDPDYTFYILIYTIRYHWKSPTAGWNKFLKYIFLCILIWKCMGTCPNIEYFYLINWTICTVKSSFFFTGR